MKRDKINTPSQPEAINSIAKLARYYYCRKRSACSLSTEPQRFVDGSECPGNSRALCLGDEPQLLQIKMVNP